MVADIPHKEETVTPADIFLYSTTNNVKHISEKFCSNIVLHPTKPQVLLPLLPNAGVCHPAVFVFFRRVKSEVKLLLYKP